MSTSQIVVNAIRDIIPTQPEPYPKELVENASSLYTSSKIKQPLSADLEIARSHLCCYVAIEKFSKKLDLPDPDMNKIPIPRRKVRSSIIDFKNGLINSSTPRRDRHTCSPSKRSATEIPSTPSKRRTTSGLITPKSTPRRLNNPFNKTTLETKSTPRSKSNQLLTPTSTPTSERNLNKSVSDRGSKSLKDKLLAAAKEKNERVSLKPKTRGRPKGKKSLESKESHITRNMITTPHLISFCNRFYIPEEITRNILDTYQIYYFKINNPWGLLCGLVAIAYLRLNAERIESQIGFRSKFYRNLQLLQNGGLTFTELSNWVNLAEKLCGGEKWIRDFYDLNTTTTKQRKLDSGIPTLNSFITPQFCYFSEEMDEKHENWHKKVQQFLEST